jgi:hypothetical protein
MHSIPREQSRRIEPQSGEYPASQNTILARREPSVFVLFQDPPIDLAVLRSPDDILLHPGTAIGSHFFLRVEGRAAGGHLDHEFRSTLEVTLFVKAGGPATLGNESEETIGLGDVIRSQAHGSVGGVSDTLGGDRVGSEPGLNQSIGFPMLIQSNWRSHIDNPVDEFGLLDLRHGFESAQKFAGAQVCAILER